MANVIVHRQSPDGLIRQVWQFHTALDHTGFALILSFYGAERRERSRGRFSKAKPADRWMSSDERGYTSGLSRPTSIPEGVLAEAWDAVPRSTYVGWKTDKHRL